MIHEDYCDSLWRSDLEKEMQQTYPCQVLPVIDGNITDTALCLMHPLIAATFDTGIITIYNWIQNSILCSYSASEPATTIVWPDAKLDGVGASLLVGFNNGTLRWLTITKSDSDVKNVEDQENDYSLALVAVVKPHEDEISCLSFNSTASLLVSQGLDSKLFFYHLEKFNIKPLGFYINRHKVDRFDWFTYTTSDQSNENCDRLLIFCKHSYILEVDIPSVSVEKRDDSLPKSFHIENNNCQVYKINSLLQYHELGDRVSESDILECSGLSENERNLLLQLKSKEKKEARENREREMGLVGSLAPPKIFCSVYSTFPDRIWLSLGKNDCGYLFEFILNSEFRTEPIDFTPVRAVEVSTDEAISVITMRYSENGRYLFMGFQDGSLQMCKLDKPFDILSISGFKKFRSDNSDERYVKDMKISKDGSIIRRFGEDGNKLVSNFNMFRFTEVNEKGNIPAFKNTEVKKMENLDGKENLSLEEMLQRNLSEKHNQVKEDISLQLEELKKRYITFKENYVAYFDKFQAQLKRMKNIPDSLKLDYGVISCSPTALDKFREETKSLQKEVDKKYQKDFVKAALLKQKYFKCFKSRIATEKFSVEEGSQKIQTFRECIMPESAQNLSPRIYSNFYEHKLDTEFKTDEAMTKKKNDELLHLKQKLASTIKDVIDYPEETAVADIVSKYNKRKLLCIEKLQEQISEAEALDNINVDKNRYKHALDEINSSYINFKDVVGYQLIFPDIILTFSEKKDDTLRFLKKINNFTQKYNSYVIDARNMKYSIDNSGNEVDSMSETKNFPLSSKNTKNAKELHISLVKRKGEVDSKRPNPTIQWNAYPEKVKLISKEGRKRDNGDKHAVHTSNQWLQKKYKNLLSVLTAAKPKINCEKKFNDIRFIMKCMELNAFKDSISNEKLYLKILSELQSILETEKSDLSTVMEEISSLRTLRQEEKIKWMDLYHDLMKLVGQNHKYKGYFKQVFKKKIVPKEEKISQKRHTSSESSESEQNINSSEDSPCVILSEIDENLLEEVMKLRLKRQEIENRMKELKRKIRNSTIKENTARKKIHKVNDAIKESLNELNLIVDSRTQAWEKLEWPVVLYPKNVHSDYIIHQASNAEEEKHVMYSEMSRINEEINPKLMLVNNFVNTSLFTLTSRVVTLEVNDLIDAASVLLPLVQNVASSSDKYFENLGDAQCLEHLEIDTKPHEPPNIIGEILATLEIPVLESELNLEIGSRKETTDTSSEESISEKDSESSLLISDHATKRISLSDFKDEEIFVTSEVNLRSWRDACNDANSLELDHEPLPKSADSDAIVSNAIPMIDYAELPVGSSSYADEYYMLPFTYFTTETDLKKLEQSSYRSCEVTKLDLDNFSNLEDQMLDPQNSSDEAQELYYPTYPGGGLKINLSVLQAMENHDKDNFPYTGFYQKAELHEELKAMHITTRIHPERTLEMDVLFNFTTRPYSQFILVDSDDVSRVINFYFEVKSCNEDLEFKLSSLQKKVTSSKRAVNLKQHDTMKGRQELDKAMKSKFGCVLDLDLLQDTLENPHFHIKEHEYEVELELLKRKLKKVKETEAVARRSLDQLRFEDTKICYELFELRKDFKILNKNYSSKYKILPKIGEITQYQTEE